MLIALVVTDMKKRLALFIALSIGSMSAFCQPTPNVNSLVKSTLGSMQSNTEYGPDHRSTPNLIVFVSLSMPDSTLKGIILQAQKLNAEVVIRGVLPSGFKATTSRLSELLIDDPNQATKEPLGGVSIDPVRFRQFAVTRVPTYVLLDDGACAVAKLPCGSEHFDQLEGNVTPISALHVFEQKGMLSPIAHRLLEQL